MSPRVFALPAIGVAMLPKCPMCVMVILGALGFQHTVHETVFAVLQAAVVLVVVTLLATRRRPTQLALGAVGACAMLLAVFGVAPAEVGLAGGALLFVTWMVKPAGPVSCAHCACSAPPGSPSNARSIAGPGMTC